jgi:hypothetical protein
MEQTNVQPSRIDESSIEDKKADLLRRKKSFERKFIFVKIAVVLLVAYPIGRAVYYRYFYKPPPDVPVPLIDKGPVVIPSTITQESFTNKDLMLALSYPSNAEISEISKTSNNSIIKMSVLYSEDKKTGDAPLKEEDIKNGYYIRVTRFISEKQNINEIIKSKLNGLKQRCEETTENSEYSPISETLVDTVGGKTFSVHKCEGNWKITYVPRFYSYYEIQQYTVGDFGFIEKYTNEADLIVNSIKFYADEPPLFEEFETFYDMGNRYTIDHRHYNSACCDVPVPPYDPQKKIVLADPSSIVDSENFDGFGVFILEGGNYSYDVLVDDYKKLLRDEYVVILGTEPVTSTEEIVVDGKRAIWLRGFSWKKNDLLIIDAKPRIIVLSVVNKSGKSFDTKMDEIISRIKVDVKPETK